MSSSKFLLVNKSLMDKSTYSPRINTWNMKLVLQHILNVQCQSWVQKRPCAFYPYTTCISCIRKYWHKYWHWDVSCHQWPVSTTLTNLCAYTISFNLWDILKYNFKSNGLTVFRKCDANKGSPRSTIHQRNISLECPSHKSITKSSFNRSLFCRQKLKMWDTKGKSKIYEKWYILDN